MLNLVSTLSTCALLLTVSVEIHPLVQSSAAAIPTRSADAPPFSAGDRLWTWTNYPYFQQCSGGFETFDFTDNYGTTAGHCAAGSSGVGTGYYTGDPAASYGYWGAIAHYSHTAIDIAIAPVSSAQGVVWASGPSARFVYNWETTAQDKVGLSVCFDGAISGEQCGATDKVINVGAKHLVQSRCAGTTHCVRGGDSGGPVYANFANGEVEALGTIVDEIEEVDGLGRHLYWAADWEPIRYIVSWLWTFNRHLNVMCEICSPHP